MSGLAWYICFQPLFFSTLRVSTLWGGVYPSPYPCIGLSPPEWSCAGVCVCVCVYPKINQKSSKDQPKSTKNRQKNHQNSILEGSRGVLESSWQPIPKDEGGAPFFGTLLGPSWGASWGRLGAWIAILGRLDAVLGRLGRVFGASCEYLGPPLGVLGRLGRVLGRLGGSLGASSGRRGASWGGGARGRLERVLRRIRANRCGCAKT